MLNSNKRTSSAAAARARQHPALAAPVGVCLAAISNPAASHGFGQLYTLPVPTWMYLYGAAAALLLSFVVFGFFVSAPPRLPSHLPPARSQLHPPATPTSSPASGCWQILGLVLLLITVLCGHLGVNDPYRNLSMTLFWVIFVLGYAYTVALTGNHFAAWNPWRGLCRVLSAARPGLFSGRYPWVYGYWPALMGYMGFIWLELLGHGRPQSLALGLSVYTLINLCAAWLWGAEKWFRYGEFFGVMFGLLGAMAPVARRATAQGSTWRWRWPFSGLIQAPATQLSILLFILFMLSSTAFDGLKSSMPFVRIYWEGLAGVFAPWLPENSIERLRLLKSLYPWWQTLVLWMSPFVYLLVYALFIWLMRVLTGTPLSLRVLALRFAMSLIPIAFVYSLTHYFTLLLTQAPRLLNLLSDPLGRGWNVLGTAHWQTTVLLDAGLVWHLQVGFILFGHIVSVYLAHVEALRVFANRRQAILSQIPMLALMVAFTVAGLWILSLPISPHPS